MFSRSIEREQWENPDAKINISNPMTNTRTCAYQGVRYVNFSKHFADVVLDDCPLNRHSKCWK